MFYVYLIHFNKPYWGKCQHYVGYTKDFLSRLTSHYKGNGSLLMNYAINKEGLQADLVMLEGFETQQEARKREVSIKKQGPCRKCYKCKSKVN